MARRDLEKRIAEQVKESVLSYAIYRPESAIIIAMTLILTTLSALNFSWFPIEWWIWPLFGAVAESLIVFSTLKDEKFQRHIFDELFHREFDVSKLHSKALQDKLAKALEYRELIVQEIEREEEPVLDDYLLNVARGLEDWIAQLYHLALGIDVYRRDPIIARDMKTVPQELERFKTALAQEKDSNLREQLAQTVAAKQSQWDTLKNLRETMAKAELQLEQTTAAMGTVYMQVVLLGAKDVESTRAQRLQEEMTEQVRAIEDISLAMDEVYQTKA